MSAPRPGALIAVVLTLTLAATACVSHPVGPARTDRTYEDKAATTAAAALSAVSTVLLTADAATKGNTIGGYAAQIVSEQEDDISGAAGTFDSIQPPSARADALRAELDAILQDAVSHVADVRIAARRGRLGHLDAVAAPLAADRAKLKAFTEAHA